MNKLVISVFCGLVTLIASPALPASAYVDDTGYLAVFGDLVKLQNDHNPMTTADEAVYYIDSDLSRRAFPNRKVYESWYADFSGVREITLEEMARIRLSGNITYRPGTRLIKIPSVPRVYAVEPGGKLRWLETEQVARDLYGDNWAQRIDDVDESFFTNYEETVPITAAAWPTGTVVRRSSDTALFFIEGSGKRHIAPGKQHMARIQNRFVIDTDSDLSAYYDFSTLSQNEIKLTDTSEIFHVETLPPASFDFPAAPEPRQTAGSEAALYVFRLTVGESVIIRDLSMELSGPLWSGDEPLISDLKFEDVHGNTLFGIKQLESAAGSATETISIGGAYTMKENTVELFRLIGTLSKNFPTDSVITTNFNESGLTLAEGGNGETLKQYWVSGEFPEYQITVTD